MVLHLCHISLDCCFVVAAANDATSVSVSVSAVVYLLVKA